jgi:antitoxin component YwqK of YwqJK toxin-antitoxin module
MRVTLLYLFLALVFGANAQIDIPNREKDSCYFRYRTVMKDGQPQKVRIKTKAEMRYLEWECGQRRGWVDCNSDLEYRQETNTVYKRVTDRSNFAGTNQPFTGDCESCYQNGRVERRVHFVNGKEEGLDTTFYESGCPQVIRELVQGIEHGTWYYMYDSTELLAWEMNYYMGEKHGKHIFFKLQEDDRRRLDTTKWENYDMGLLDGYRRTYHDNGVLKSEVKYDHGVYNGPFRLFNNERVIIQELNYKDGEKDEENLYYFDDGTLLRTESWDEGTKHGEFKTFYYDQTIQKTENYKKGRKQGWFEEFYPDGTAKNRKLYDKDELIEEHRYDEHGRETYSFGTPDSDQSEDDEMPKKGKRKKKKD